MCSASRGALMHSSCSMYSMSRSHHLKTKGASSICEAVISIQLSLEPCIALWCICSLSNSIQSICDSMHMRTLLTYLLWN